MGLVEAVVEWRPYILGYKTIVRTDHKSLKWLMTCQHPDGSRVANWALRIQEYGVEINHAPGKEHVVPDCLSRAVAAAICSALQQRDYEPLDLHAVVMTAAFAYRGANLASPESSCGAPVFCITGGPLAFCFKISAPTEFVGVPESQLHIRNSLSNSEALIHPEIVISTANGARTLAKLLKLGVRDSDGSLVTTVNIEMNINDTGSGAELMGYKTFQWLKLMRPSCVTQRDVPLKTSLRSIAGIGGVNNVMFWCQLTLDFGGQPLKYDDIAILRHHDGILLGNDTLAQGRACICYGDQQTTASGVVCDGTVRLRDKAGNFISDPVPFSTRRNTPGQLTALHFKVTLSRAFSPPTPTARRVIATHSL
jgi:hypothetical protein